MRYEDIDFNKNYRVRQDLTSEELTRIVTEKRDKAKIPYPSPTILSILHNKLKSGEDLTLRPCTTPRFRAASFVTMDLFLVPFSIFVPTTGLAQSKEVVSEVKELVITKVQNASIDLDVVHAVGRFKPTVITERLFK